MAFIKSSSPKCSLWSMYAKYERLSRLGFLAAIERLPDGHLIKDSPAYKTVAQRKYVRVPRIVSITRPEQVGGFGGSDFSPETIKQRADEGYAQTKKALEAADMLPGKKSDPGRTAKTTVCSLTAFSGS
jgi:hypothetical protein